MRCKVTEQSRDPFIDQIAAELKRPVRFDARFDERVMEALNAPEVIPLHPDSSGASAVARPALDAPGFADWRLRGGRGTRRSHRVRRLAAQPDRPGADRVRNRSPTATSHR